MDAHSPVQRRRRFPLGLILLLVFIAAGLVILRVYLKFPATMPEPSAPPPAIQNIPVLPNHQGVSATYDGPTPTIPSTIPLYQNSEHPQSLESLGNQLAARLSLTAKPGAAALWVSASGTEWLHLDERNQLISYSRQSAASGATGPLNPDQATAAAAAWISSVLNIRDATVLPDIRYFRGGGAEMLPESDPAKATVADIPFGLSIDSYPVYVDNSALPLATLRVDKKNSIVSAYIKPITLDPSRKESLPTVPVETILNQLSRGQALLIQLTPDSAIIPAQHPPTSAVMDRATVVYRLDSSTRTLYPYLQFSGVAQLSNSGGSAAIILAVPIVILSPSR